MSNVKIVLNEAGVRNLLRSGAMQAVCNERANTIRQRCGDGYEVSSHVGRNRCNASVVAGTYEAKRDNLKNKTIMKATR